MSLQIKKLQIENGMNQRLLTSIVPKDTFKEVSKTVEYVDTST